MVKCCRRYGIVGKNGAGKTTLMTLIAEGAIKEIAPTVKRLHVRDIKAYSKLNEVPAVAIRKRTPENLCAILICFD